MLMTVMISLLIFSVAYLVNIFYITVLYHRGLCHGAVELRPWMTKWTALTGSWLTGIDPKAWVAMHRYHHMYSDTKLDSHSPVHKGVFGVAFAQLKSYEYILRKLIKGDKKVSQIVQDLPFGVSYLNRKKLWYVPYVLHTVIAILISAFTGSIWFGVAYYFGMMSHPVQGWMVNSLAHRFGYRNFKDINDNSKNNYLVSLFVFGEGFQNNHHANPNRANFARRYFEIDLGYVLCLIAVGFGMLKLKRLSAEVPSQAA